MEKLIKNIGPIILLVASVIFAFLYGKSEAEDRIDYIEKVKLVKITQAQVDSIQKLIPPKEKRVVVYQDRIKYLKEKEKDINYNEEECKEIVDNLKEQLANQDTIIITKDSIIYDTKTIIEKQEIIIDNTEVVRPKTWSIGIQAGYGTDFKSFRPYIGVGISKNIKSF